MTRAFQKLTFCSCFIAALSAQESDPFAGISEAKPAEAPAATTSWTRRLFTDNLGFRKEIMSQFDVDENGKGASRQSVGFEVLKKFSTSNSTVASFDFQG